MKKARYKYLVEKSLSACMSAIEIYNKPDFQFREEAFSVLMCTAWELLLKAKILKDNKNDFNAIVEKDYKTTKAGKRSKRKHTKFNRAGNAMTIGLFRALEIVRGKGNGVETKCHENLMLLVEIRDNAIHFVNKSTSFGKNVQEVGTANLRNFMTIAGDWFNVDFTRYNFYLMPLSFYSSGQLIEAASGAKRGSKQLQNIEKLIRATVKNHPVTEDEKFSVALELNVKFAKSSESSGIRVKQSNEPGAIPITISEEDVLKRYPLDFDDVVSKMRSRVKGFKQTDRFYAIKRELEADEKLCKVRLLDPKNPKSPRKKYYSPEILKELEKRWPNGQPGARL